MKTAISIPTSVFEQAEALACRLRLSRSELYTRAVEALLAAERDREITARLDEVYAKESSDLDPVFSEVCRQKWTP